MDRTTVASARLGLHSCLQAITEELRIPSNKNGGHVAAPVAKLSQAALHALIPVSCNTCSSKGSGYTVKKGHHSKRNACNAGACLAKLVESSKKRRTLACHTNSNIEQQISLCRGRARSFRRHSTGVFQYIWNRCRAGLTVQRLRKTAQLQHRMFPESAMPCQNLPNRAKMALQRKQPILSQCPKPTCPGDVILSHQSINK